MCVYEIGSTYKRYWVRSYITLSGQWL